MSEHSTERLGTYRGRTYHLTIGVFPNFNRIRDFAVVVHRSTSGPIGEQIAHIDTTHGYTHFDRLYRSDQPKERVDVDVWEAAALVRANWRTNAESFDRLDGE